MLKNLINGTRLEQLFAKVERDRHLPMAVLREKAVHYLQGAMLSPVYLRDCTRVGKGARASGKPFISNHGLLTVGDDFHLSSEFVQSHLVVGPSGALEICDWVAINFGAAISAHERIRIGNRVRLGPYAIVMDSDYHDAADRTKKATSPVVIEDDVWLAVRVTVLKGAHIGKGSVITANSVVAGDIPPNSIAGGVPARVLKRVSGAAPAEAASASPTPGALDPSVEARALKIIARTFALEGAIDPSWGPKQIPKWDSLGQMHLTIALETEFGVQLTESQLIGLVDVASVVRAVSASVAQRRRDGSPST
jgi:maltose O-acetyltransferase